MGKQIPIVDYLAHRRRRAAPRRLGGGRLRCALLRPAQRRRQGRRHRVQAPKLATTGKVRSFTIVHRGVPGVPVPYVSALVDLDGGGTVKANLSNIPPDPEHVKLGMAVKMTTFAAGTDDDGTEAIAFAFEPAS